MTEPAISSAAAAAGATTATGSGLVRCLRGVMAARPIGAGR